MQMKLVVSECSLNQQAGNPFQKQLTVAPNEGLGQL